jgi:hypothetical protein
MINWGAYVRHVVKARLGLISVLPFVIPLTLAPLLVVWWWLPLIDVGDYREDLLFSCLVYIVVVRFMLLDLMLFYVSSKRNSIHFDLLHIVFLYLEITAVTLLFFALLYHLFGVFELFDYNGLGVVKHMLTMQGHSWRVALYISVELFTTLGLGDWVPRTLNAMLAVSIEALLGFVQGGVFFAVLIYAHQSKAPSSG